MSRYLSEQGALDMLRDSAISRDRRVAYPLLWQRLAQELTDMNYAVMLSLILIKAFLFGKQRFSHVAANITLLTYTQGQLSTSFIFHMIVKDGELINFLKSVSLFILKPYKRNILLYLRFRYVFGTFQGYEVV